MAGNEFDFLLEKEEQESDKAVSADFPQDDLEWLRAGGENDVLADTGTAGQSESSGSNIVKPGSDPLSAIYDLAKNVSLEDATRFVGRTAAGLAGPLAVAGLASNPLSWPAILGGAAASTAGEALWRKVTPGEEPMSGWEAGASFGLNLIPEAITVGAVTAKKVGAWAKRLGGKKGIKEMAKQQVGRLAQVAKPISNEPVDQSVVAARLFPTVADSPSSAAAMEAMIKPSHPIRPEAEVLGIVDESPLETVIRVGRSTDRTPMQLLKSVDNRITEATESVSRLMSRLSDRPISRDLLDRYRTRIFDKMEEIEAIYGLPQLDTPKLIMPYRGDVPLSPVEIEKRIRVIDSRLEKLGQYTGGKGQSILERKPAVGSSKIKVPGEKVVDEETGKVVTLPSTPLDVEAEKELLSEARRGLRDLLSDLVTERCTDDQIKEYFSALRDSHNLLTARPVIVSTGTKMNQLGSPFGSSDRPYLRAAIPAPGLPVISVGGAGAKHISTTGADIVQEFADDWGSMFQQLKQLKNLENLPTLAKYAVPRYRDVEFPVRVSPPVRALGSIMFRQNGRETPALSEAPPVYAVSRPALIQQTPDAVRDHIDMIVGAAKDPTLKQAILSAALSSDDDELRKTMARAVQYQPDLATIFAPTDEPSAPFGIVLDPEARFAKKQELFQQVQEGKMPSTGYYWAIKRLAQGFLPETMPFAQ